MKQNFFDSAIRLISGDCSYDADGKTILKWKSLDVSQPSQSEIDAEIIRLQAEYDAKKYQRDRRYPSIGDQLDEIYHNGIDEWKKTIKKVKDAHPKPE